MEPELELDVNLIEISSLVQLMIKDAIVSFVNRDIDLAMKVITQDEEVNKLCRESMTKILQLMMQDSAAVTRGFKLNAVIRHLERIADHATNIAEMVIYLIEGKIIRHTLPQQNPKDGNKN